MTLRWLDVCLALSCLQSVKRCHERLPYTWRPLISETLLRLRLQYSKKDLSLLLVVLTTGRTSRLSPSLGISLFRTPFASEASRKHRLSYLHPFAFAIGTLWATELASRIPEVLQLVVNRRSEEKSRRLPRPNFFIYFFTCRTARVYL